MLKKSFLSVLVLPFLLTSCDPPQAGLDAEDERNPYFKKAATFLDQDLYHAAIKEYLNAIQKGGDAVAWAYVEIGLIYSEKLGDQISAIYHYNKYIAIRPHAPEAERVKNYIEKAKIDLVLTLPRPPSQEQELQRLRDENKALRGKIAQLQSSIAGNKDGFAKRATGITLPAKPEKSPQASPFITTGPRITSTSGPSARLPIKPAEKVQAEKPTVSTTESQASAGRTYIVEPGDSLWKISRKFYPDNVAGGVDKIKQANQQATANVLNLKVGQQLLIP